MRPRAVLLALPLLLCIGAWAQAPVPSLEARVTDLTGTLTAVTSSFVARDAARVEAADHFTAGWIRFTSGNNAGLKALEIKSYASDGTFETFEPFYYLPQVGDAYETRKGCRRREADCQANGNIINFFGFTRIPTASTYISIGDGT